MKNILFILLLTFFGCSKYQVVSKVRVNLYHLHNPKTNDVELILTKEELNVGGWYRINTIKTIDIKDENSTRTK